MKQPYYIMREVLILGIPSNVEGNVVPDHDGSFMEPDDLYWEQLAQQFSPPPQEIKAEPLSKQGTKKKSVSRREAFYNKYGCRKNG